MIRPMTSRKYVEAVRPRFAAMGLTACITDPPKVVHEYRVLNAADCLGSVDSVTVSESTMDTTTTFHPCEVGE